ncbi:MAG TPA: hypothetical protein VLV78_00540 [Thermoanaerobaculia bacterium]|nr:hypothetical protein [Thermoanaerobaculia bacterium]
MSRNAVQRIVAGCGALLLCAALIHRYAIRRPPYFAAPETVLDHADVVKHEIRDALVVIPQAEPLLPRGAEVTCFRPKNAQAWNDDAVYLTAVGLLPRQSVLPPWSAGTGRGVEYVIAVGAPFDQPSYAPYAGFRGGWLYKRR